MYTVLEVMYVNDLVFWSCPQCMFKMTESTSTSYKKSLFCEKCYDYYMMSQKLCKYKLSMKICNNATRMISKLTVFGKSLENVIGCEAHHYQRILDENPEKISTQRIKHLLLQSLKGKIITVCVTNQKDFGTSHPVITGHDLKVHGFSRADCLLHKICLELDVVGGMDKSRTPTAKVLDEANPGTTSNNPGQVTIAETKELWHESLIQEFNQSLVLDNSGVHNDNILTSPSKYKSKKRLRELNSLNNTPSAPIRTRARTVLNVTQNEQHFENHSIFSPFSLPNGFKTPIRSTRLCQLVNKFAQDEVVLPMHDAITASTPCKSNPPSHSSSGNCSRTILVDPSRDLFSDSEADEL